MSDLDRKPLRSGARFLLLTMLITIAVLVASLVTVNRIDVGGGRGWDGQVYGAMADSILMGGRIVAPGPYVYRIGTPMLAAVVARVMGMSIEDSFLFVNVIAALLSVLLLFLFLARSAGPSLAFVGSCLYVAMWHAPVRFVFYDPVLVDPWFWVVWLAGLLSLTSTPGPSIMRTMAIGFLLLAGAFVRESVILLPLAMLLSDSAVRGPLNRAWRWLVRSEAAPPGDSRAPASPGIMASLILIAFVLVGVLVSHQAVESLGSYSFARTAFSSAYHASIAGAILAMCVAFGPVLILLFARWPAAAAHLATHPLHTAILLVVAAAAVAGGTDTMRFLFWAAPVVLLMVVLCLRDYLESFRSDGGPPHRMRRGILVLAMIGSIQLVASLPGVSLPSRVVAALLNRNLMPAWGGSMLLAAYVGIMAVLLLAMRWAESDRSR